MLPWKWDDGFMGEIDGWDGGICQEPGEGGDKCGRGAAFGGDIFSFGPGVEKGGAGICHFVTGVFGRVVG